MFLFLRKTVDLWILRNAHDQYTNPLERPLLIALQDVRCMGSSSPPHLWDNQTKTSEKNRDELTQQDGRGKKTANLV